MPGVSFDPSGRSAAFLVMGCHGFGTAGSTQLLRDPALARQLAAEVEQRDFAAIAEILVQGHEYGTRIIESFPQGGLQTVESGAMELGPSGPRH